MGKTSSASSSCGFFPFLIYWGVIFAYIPANAAIERGKKKNVS